MPICLQARAVRVRRPSPRYLPRQSTAFRLCGKCISCAELGGGGNLDILEIDAASNNGVDEIRDLRDNVKYLPSVSKYKVYIIDEVHMLSNSAFNALLKTLEEPPEHVIFILATTEVQKIPPTVLSRCMRFDFRLLTIDELVSLLATVMDGIGKRYEQEALIAIATAGAGSARDTLSLADMCILLRRSLGLSVCNRGIGTMFSRYGNQSDSGYFTRRYR